MRTKTQILLLAIFGNLGLAAIFLSLNINELAEQEKNRLDDAASVYEQAWKFTANDAFFKSVGAWHPYFGDSDKINIWSENANTTLFEKFHQGGPATNYLLNAISAGEQSEIDRVLEGLFGREIGRARLSFVAFLDNSDDLTYCMTAAEGFGADPCAANSVTDFSLLTDLETEPTVTGSFINVVARPDIVIVDDQSGVSKPSVFDVVYFDVISNKELIGTVILGKNLFETIELFEARFDIKVAMSFSGTTLILDEYANVENYSGISIDADIVSQADIAVDANRGLLTSTSMFGYMDEMLEAAIFGFPINTYVNNQQVLFMVLKDQRAVLQQNKQAMESALTSGLTFFVVILLAIVGLINYAFNGIVRAVQVLQALIKGDDKVEIERKNSWLRSDDDEIAMLSGALESYRAHLVEMNNIKQSQEYNRQQRDAIMLDKMRHLADQLDGKAKHLILSDVEKMIELANGGVNEGSDDASVELMSMAFSRMSDEVTALLDARTQEMQEAYEQAANANREIQSSINYAAKLQRALLRAERFPDDFKIHITWQPRDVVGGDIYVVRTTENKTVIAVIDCTGHGVPGAFTSIIARAVIDRAIEDESITTAGDYLSISNRLIKDMLFQNDMDEAESDAGFDGTVCILDREAGTLEFAGANSSLFVMNGGAVTEYKGDKKSVGARRTPRTFEFTTQIIHDPSGMFVMLTDGVTDVMNEMPRPIAFGRKRLVRLIETMNTSDPAQVVGEIMEAINSYKGSTLLRDDLTLLAFYIDELRCFEQSVVSQQIAAPTKLVS